MKSEEQISFDPTFMVARRLTKRGAVLTLEVPAMPLNANLLYQLLKRKEKEEEKPNEQKE